MKRLVLIPWILLAACSSPPPQAKPREPAPSPAAPSEPAPTVKADRSSESDYDLSAYAGRLAKAEEYALDGKRAAGAFVLSGVKLRLDESKTRERLFLDLKMAEVWGGESNAQLDDRDEAKALNLIQSVEAAAPADSRLLADAHVARAVVAVGGFELEQAESAFLAAMTRYEKAGAYVRSVEAARFALRVFYKRNEDQRALRFARLGYLTAQDLDKPGALCLVALDCAMLSFRAKSNIQGGEYVQDAYAAALKTNNLRYINAVIAQAVLEYYGLGEFEAAARWGEAMRRDGGFPTQILSGLAPYEYARTLGLLGLSLAALPQAIDRAKPVLDLAKEATAQALKDTLLGAVERKELEELAEKVDSALLKISQG